MFLKRIKFILFYLISWVVILGFLELFLRWITTGSLYLFESNPHIMDQQKMYRMTSNYDGWWYGMHYKLDSHGFRMPYEIRKNPTKLRILAMGDSITEGIGVIHDEDVWPCKLEKKIRQATGDSVEVINTGIQGWDLLERHSDGKYTSKDFRKFIQNEAAQFKPDIIIYCICLNDIPSPVSDAFTKDNSENKKKFTFFPESWREFFKRKAIYRLARDLYREQKFKKLDFSSLPSNNLEERVWKQASEELGSLKETIHHFPASFYCIIVPHSYQILAKNRNLLEVNRRWGQALKENEIPFVDITEFLNQDAVLSYFALGDYVHPNARGHELISEKAFELIQKEIKRTRPIKDGH